MIGGVLIAMAGGDMGGGAGVLVLAGFFGLFASILVRGARDLAPRMDEAYSKLMRKLVPKRYGLIGVVPPTLDYASCQQRFLSFQRGDKDQRIVDQDIGEYRGHEHAFAYSTYRFEYVALVSKGNGKGVSEI